MTAFGFSAFLKLVSLNPRPQLTAIRNRLRPREGGYDFHRGFRALAKRYVVDGEDFEVVLSDASDLPDAEVAPAQAALNRLATWRANNSGTVYRFDPATWESEGGYFKVKFEPDFGIQINGTTVAVHIWKTANPALDARMTYAALALVSEAYESVGNSPDDVAVLSMIDGRLYRLSEVAGYAPIGHAMANRLDDLFEREIEIRDRPDVGDQPGA